jgi:hypothetical protein
LAKISSAIVSAGYLVMVGVFGDAIVSIIFVNVVIFYSVLITF